MPTVEAAIELTNNVNYSLAALRGYMILGNESFKSQRQTALQQVQKQIEVIEANSQSWPQEDKKELEALKEVLVDFTEAQQSADSTAISLISQTDEGSGVWRIRVRDEQDATRRFMAIKASER